MDEKGSQIVQFSHFSVKEFLTSSRIASSRADISTFHILLEPAHTVLASTCLAVLLRLGELVDEHEVEDKFPLARYAAEHWVDHARFENVSSNIREGMEDLFDPDKPYFTAWLQVYDIDTAPLPGSLLYSFAPFTLETSNSAIPLYYAALCGFHDLAEHLIFKHPQQVYTTGGYFMSPLGAALRGGHLKIAQILYERGADVEVQGRDKCTLLDGASCFGNVENVQWLLGRGANPNHQIIAGNWTSLHTAAWLGQVEISLLLLQYKADIYARDRGGRTPLHLVMEYGHVNLARLLLEHGADVNARDINRDTPLITAVKYNPIDTGSLKRRFEIARLLVEHGANIDAEDNEGRTAFQVASDRGYHSIAKLLSNNGSK